ncbi:hypothetical protein [uncultured Sulfitobacter sp.]|uniref:hypothetical protein n=1 Tax=uncultured Sulfitobacter sp. TaxID=191468 RepID=UPI00263380DA|nr:hypothetical protein [uncultured Sulfitobacter sp.]
MLLKPLEENEKLCELHALCSMLDYAALRASEIGADALVASIEASKAVAEQEIKNARFLV